MSSDIVLYASLSDVKIYVRIYAGTPKFVLQGSSSADRVSTPRTIGRALRDRPEFGKGGQIHYQ